LRVEIGSFNGKVIADLDRWPLADFYWAAEDCKPSTLVFTPAPGATDTSLSKAGVADFLHMEQSIDAVRDIRLIWKSSGEAHFACVLPQRIFGLTEIAFCSYLFFDALLQQVVQALPSASWFILEATSTGIIS
jgi:hypothetical protein